MRPRRCPGGQPRGPGDDQRAEPERRPKGIHDRIIFRKNADGSYVSQSRVPLFSKTDGAYAAVIDDFYRRYPRSDVAIGDIVVCLHDAAGAACRQMLATGHF